MPSEQGFLRASIFATVLVATFGIVLGLLSGSFSITFDGVYSLADAGMTVLSLWVSNLIAKSTPNAPKRGRIHNRFTRGFWHLEPIVLGLNGTLLMAVAIYALINAMISILHGGNHLTFSYAIVYAGVTVIACVVMAVVGAKVNRRLRSDFIRLDVKAWLMAGGISAALLVAFVIGYAADGSRFNWISPYIDPVVLALVCLIIIPLPVATVRQAMRDILLIAPAELKAHVDRVAVEAVRRHNFVSYRAYVAQVGRAIQVELYFMVPEEWPPKSMAEWDRMRDEIGAAVGSESHDRWLTIVFTGDVAWAE